MVDKQDHNLRQFQWAALGVVLLTIAIRLPSLLHPQPIDSESMYSVVANEIVDGGRPYLDAVERKPPLLFWTYAAVFELAGKYNWKVLHVVALVWTLATMAGLYLIGTRLFDRNTGLIAALFYSVFQPCGRAQNIALDGELLMNLPIVWAWAIGFRRSSSRIRPELLLSGALLGVAFLLKQPAAIAAVPLGIYLLLPSYRTSRRLLPTASVTQARCLQQVFLGLSRLWLPCFIGQGILREAIYWTINDHTIPYVFWKKGILVTLAYVVGFLPLLMGAAMAIRDERAIWTGKNAERTALLGLLVASAVGAAASARFYEHYYIQLVPPAWDNPPHGRLIRLPSLLHPQPIDDEAGYSVIANEIVDGGRPYIDAVDRKPPLLFWTYAAVFKVAGEYNWLALHMLSLIWTLATMAGLYA
jgi:4-amino-4-deoxy-L-arabinose transferase-like glycosyltransferase